MAKTAKKHFTVNEWKVEEREFSPEFSQVAESVFSLGNEYMGCRGFLDERTSAPSLVGNYFNGVYEYSQDKTYCGYKGIVTQTHYMVNAVNFFDLELRVNGQKLDMAETPYFGYRRELDLKSGKLLRELTWKVDGAEIKTSFCRFLDMSFFKRAYQRAEFCANADIELTLTACARFDEKHFQKPSRWQKTFSDSDCIECETESTSQRIACAFYCDFNGKVCDSAETEGNVLKKTFRIKLKKGEKGVFTRYVAAAVNKTGSAAEEAKYELALAVDEGYENAYRRNGAYWADFWDRSDIEIVGDEENQQGVRFCIFQLQQTYHGAQPTDNIGAKGLTGEAYSGHAFWDTETYCLPYYLFNNPKAAKYLLEYRYATLEQAKKRAKDLDCRGACYPIATLNGEEACNLWQHASLQMQPSTGVAYGIFHYAKVCGDYGFLYAHGAEMLVEICRYLVSRGQWDADNEYFGYYAVMGPDEFQMMVNHNTYTNYMAKKTLKYTLEVIDGMPEQQRLRLFEKLKISKAELDIFRLCEEKMLILFDERTLLYEQHDGFFKLPHINVDDIPDCEFPLYSHWSYDRIYRNDMIKQPDVLMFQLLYNGDFSKECKKANYEYYEPRCIHESSLSPSVHSVLACELGKYDEAYGFFAFATRMDLDDYNRNAREGLHTTSIAAAWLNIVYGFGGLRSDKELGIAPVLPANWEKYSFAITVNGSNLKITVNKDGVTVENRSDAAAVLSVYGKSYTVKDTLTVKI